MANVLQTTKLKFWSLKKTFISNEEVKNKEFELIFFTQFVRNTT